VLAYRWGSSEIFAKISNLFNSFIYSELGFPWRGRYFEIGFKTDVLKLIPNEK
jgi:iron complex outermembrane receptor protein